MNLKSFTWITLDPIVFLLILTTNKHNLRDSQSSLYLRETILSHCWWKLIFDFIAWKSSSLKCVNKIEEFFSSTSRSFRLCLIYLLKIKLKGQCLRNDAYEFVLIKKKPRTLISMLIPSVCIVRLLIWHQTILFAWKIIGPKMYFWVNLCVLLWCDFISFSLFFAAPCTMKALEEMIIWVLLIFVAYSNFVAPTVYKNKLRGLARAIVFFSIFFAYYTILLLFHR